MRWRLVTRIAKRSENANMHLFDGHNPYQSPVPVPPLACDRPTPTGCWLCFDDICLWIINLVGHAALICLMTMITMAVFMLPLLTAIAVVVITYLVAVACLSAVLAVLLFK